MYTQLYTMTSDTLLCSLIHLEDYVKKSKQHGALRLGVMDENRMGLAFDFYKACKSQGIQPILGMSFVYVVEGEKYSLQLVAKTREAFQKLMQLSTATQVGEVTTLEAARPFFQKEVLIIAHTHSEFYAYAKQNFSKLEKWVKLFENNPNFYVGVCLETDSLLLDTLKQLHLKPFAMQEVRYLTKEEHFSLEIAKCIQEQTVPQLETLPKQGELYYRNETESTQTFQERGLSEALENVEKALEEVNVTLTFHQGLYPKFPVEKGETAQTLLRKLAQNGLEKRIGTVSKAYQERLEEELSVIEELGFSDYFLITWDVLKFARKEKIFLGAGRGSAAGSLVSYALKITNVDPIHYQLLFERFLNKERFNPPDIDIDIPDDKRPLVLDYVWEKYGHNHVAHIATYGTLKAKQVLTDVARVFGLSVSEQRRFSKAIPNVLNITLAESYERSKNLRDIVQQTSKNKWIFETAKSLEGLPRNISTHAAGVIICDRSLREIIPLQQGRQTIFSTQSEQGILEEIGLLKMDFLGLKNLKYIQKTLDSILYTTREQVPLMQVDLTDSKTLSLFQKGDTLGIFQFESSGMRQALKQVAPSSFEDVIAMVALFRPGPQANIPSFAKRKAGKEAIHYLDDTLQPILQNTYGIMVYQEQVMQVVQQYAGYSLGEADILRRVMSKKKKEEMDKGRAEFVRRAVLQKHSEKKAEEIYDYIEKFADYGFNRSHAVAYSFVSFQLAYLKAHFPTNFFQTMLHYQPDKIKEYAGDAKRFGVKLKTPDINRSHYGFSVEGEKHLRFGLGNITGVRKDFIDAILLERKNMGHFTDICDLLMRLEEKWLKIETFLPLIYSGCFDVWEKNRRKVEEIFKANIDNILLIQGSFLEEYGVKIPDEISFSEEEKREREMAYLGLNLGKHKTEQHTLFQLVQNTTQISQFSPKEKVNAILEVLHVKEIHTKKKERMAFVELEDATGKIDAVFFPESYLNIARNLEKSSVLYVEGHIDFKRDSQELQLIIERAQPIEQAIKHRMPAVCFIQTDDTQQEMSALKTLCQDNTKKEIPVFAVRKADKKTILLPKNYWLDKEEKCRGEVEEIFGKENVILKKM